MAAGTGPPTARQAGVLLAELLLLTALPLVLWLLGGDPIPRTWPSLEQLQVDWNGLRAEPAQSIDYLVPVLIDVVWILWACYALSATVALITTVMQVVVRLLPRLTPTTVLGTLVATATLTAPPGHFAAHATANRPAPQPLPEDQHARVRLTLSAAATATTSGTSASVHLVVPGENLWEIAEHYYGTGAAWRSIYNANAGRPQGDGQALTDPDLIQPGWQLIIPARTNATATPGTQSGTVPTTPATTAPTPPTTGPSTPTPASRLPHAPTPGPMSTGAPRPAPVRVQRPHTVGLILPADAGYTGITLIAATAAAVAVLRTRNRHHCRPTDTDIPPLAQHLAAVHDAAQSVHTYGFQPDQHPGHQPPPLLRPQPGTPILGTAANPAQETDLDAVLRSTAVLTVTGPGALNAARAAAVSILAATPSDTDTPNHILITDQHLADQLLATTEGTDRTTDWLEIAPTPEAALARYQRHAHTPRMTDHAQSATETRPTAHAARVTLIQHTDPQLWDILLETHRLDPEHHLSALLIGSADLSAGTHMSIHLDADGTLLHATGPGADQITGARPHTLTRTAAAEIYHTLATARPRRPAPNHSPTTPRTDTPRASDTGDTREACLRQSTTSPAGQSPPTQPARHGGIPEHSTATPPLRVARPTMARTQLIEANPASPPHCDPAARTTESHGTPQTNQDPRTLADTPLLVRVLGTPDILGPDHHVALATEQGAALITLLALHPEGLSSAAILEHEWPKSTSDRENRQKLASAVSRVRIPLRTAFNQGEASASEPVLFDTRARSYQLNPELITTDLALTRRLSAGAQHAEDLEVRLNLLTQAAALHRGEPGAHLDTNHRDWLTTARYTILTERLALHLAIAKATTATRPTFAAEHLRTAVTLAPEDRDTLITALQLCLHLPDPTLGSSLFRQHTAALHLIDEAPDAETTRLARRALEHTKS